LTRESISELHRAADAEFAHAGLKRGAFHANQQRGAKALSLRHVRAVQLPAGAAWTFRTQAGQPSQGAGIAATCNKCSSPFAARLSKHPAGNYNRCQIFQAQFWIPFKTG
jgi:hypothetical protein